MQKKNHFFQALFRIDNFNRVIVLVSMVLFIVLPSIILYDMDDEKYSFVLIIACLLQLGFVIGNGLFVLLKPLRTTWIYFLICLVSFPFLFSLYETSLYPLGMNLRAILIFSMAYSGLGFLINILYFISLFKRKSKIAFNEKTNNDNIYDFLGGAKKNKEISEKLDEIVNQNSSHAANIIRHSKFSRLIRNIDFLILFSLSLVYFISTISKNGFEKNLFAINMFLLLLILPICIVSCYIFPTDFKYIYYFNALFLLVTAIIESKFYEMNTFFLILMIILTGLSLLLTLIVEGRTWTGANPD